MSKYIAFSFGVHITGQFLIVMTNWLRFLGGKSYNRERSYSKDHVVWRNPFSYTRLILFSRKTDRKTL